MRERTKNELRCFCSRKPLLAAYGIDKNGRLYVHVKIFKQQRIYGEVLVTDGVVKLHCRECLRWHTVVIRQPGTAVLEEDTDPPPVINESQDGTLASGSPDPLRCVRYESQSQEQPAR